MPTGPKGEKRPADVIGNAVHVMRGLTGEIRRHYPWVRIHKTLRVTPAMAAGLSETVMDWTNIVKAMDADRASTKARPLQKDSQRNFKLRHYRKMMVRFPPPKSRLRLGPAFSAVFHPLQGSRRSHNIPFHGIATGADCDPRHA
jgi:hypothetical protein